MKPSLALLLALSSACSFFLQDVDVGTVDTPPRCDDGIIYPVLDTAAMVGGGVIFYGAIHCDAETEADGNCFGEAIAGIFLAAPATLAFALSAIYGYTRANQCADRKALFQERAAAPRPPQPVPVVPPPQPPPPSQPPPPPSPDPMK